ncbi:hypothetical protein ERO13_D08G078325v2 [Gossypium hirsutum]|nr:hypothetical protein ERO13_D08G078325v2 [Gossypium hirsutum]
MQNLIRRFQLPKTTVTKILTLCLLSFFLPAPIPSKNSFNLVPSVVSSLALMDELRQPFLKAQVDIFNYVEWIPILAAARDHERHV